MSVVSSPTSQQAQVRENPFVGLRAFQSWDKDWFFGRDSAVHELLRTFKTNRLVAVVGAAGVGKASLIQSGLLPALTQGYEGVNGRQWGIASFTPTENPITRLADALIQRNVLSPDIKAEPGAEKVEATLRRSSLGLVTAVKERQEAIKGKNILIVVRQFEELFRLMEDDSKKNEARDFVKLLLRAIKEESLPIYVLISIDSEFLADLTKFRGLPEVVNQGQYLVPRMTKQQLRKVIMEPIALTGESMAGTVRGTILDDVDTSNDQLPLLQHALHRLWGRYQAAKAADPEVESLEGRHYRMIGDFDALLQSDFEERMQQYGHHMDYLGELSNQYEHRYRVREAFVAHLGARNESALVERVDELMEWYATRVELEYYQGLERPMQKALGLHAEELYYSMSMTQKRITEQVLKAITDGRLGIENVKIKSVVILELAAIAQASVDEVREVLRLLLDAHFITTDAQDLNARASIRLTHSCVVRHWNRLRDWVLAETESAKTYLRLAGDAAIRAATPEKQGLWQDNQLEFGEAWYKEYRPNEAWAMQYHPGYSVAIAFLEESMAARDAREAAKARALASEKARRRMILIIVSVAAVICLMLAGWAIGESRKAKKSKIQAEIKAEEAMLSKLEAENEKQNARVSAREAKRQAEIASEKEIIAQRASQKARVAAEEARVAAEEAKRQEIIAIQQGKVAENEKRIAKKKEEEARLAERAAKRAEALAQKLKYQSVAEKIAISSVAIENQNLQRAQVAKKAHEIYLLSDPAINEVYSPAIYQAMYYGVKGLKEDQKQGDFNWFAPNSERRGMINRIIGTAGDEVYLVGSDGRIFKWRVTQWAAVDKPQVSVTTLGSIGTALLSADLSTSGKLAVAGKDRQISIYKTAQPDATPTVFNVHSNRYVWCVRFWDKSQLVSSGEDKRVRLTNIYTKESRVVLQAAVNIRHLDISPKGLLVCGDDQGQLWTLDLNTPGAVATKATTLAAPITALCISPDGKTLSVGTQKGSLHFFDPADMSLKNEYEAHTVSIVDIQFRDNESVVTVSHDRTGKLWSLPDLRNDYQPIVFNDHPDWCTSVGFSANGNQVLIGCKDGSVKVWPVHASTLARTLCALLPDKQIDGKDRDKYIGNAVDVDNFVCNDL